MYKQTMKLFAELEIKRKEREAKDMHERYSNCSSIHPCLLSSAFPGIKSAQQIYKYILSVCVCVCPGTSVFLFRKRQREEEIETQEKAKREKEWQKNFEVCFTLYYQEKY